MFLNKKSFNLRRKYYGNFKKNDKKKSDITVTNIEEFLETTENISAEDDTSKKSQKRNNKKT